MTLGGARRGYVKPVYTTRDYVQNGLIAMWDGIENAGWGVHNTSARTWFDLTGNGASVSLASAVSFTNNSLKLHGATSASEARCNLTPSNAIDQLKDYTTAKFAIEVIFHSLENSMASTFLVTLFAKNAYNRVAGIGFDNGKKLRVGDVYTLRDGSADITHPVTMSAAVNFNNSAKRISSYNNGILFANITTGLVTGSFDSLPCRIFGDNGYTGYKDCEIFALRIYGRELSAVEIAANYAIDKVRFKIPD